jgi:hypothetical protein
VRAPSKTELRGKKWWARVGYSRFFAQGLEGHWHQYWPGSGGGFSPTNLRVQALSKTELRGKKWWARVGYSRFFQRHSMLLIMDFVGWILQLVYFVMTWYGLMRDLPQPF